MVTGLSAIHRRRRAGRWAVVRAATALAIGLWPTLATGAAAQTDNDLPLSSELLVTQPAGITVPRTGGTGVLEATVSNDGSVAAPATSVRVTLPDGVLPDPTLPGDDGRCTADSQELTCDAGTLPPGGTLRLAIGVRTGELGLGEDLAAIAAAPTSARWDPTAGELSFRAWDLEAGGQGTSLQDCWPVTNPAPNMDLSGGDPDGETACDGENDRPPPRPSVQELQSAFPPASSELVTRSWEWRTRVTPAFDGPYRVCAEGIDDGGYVAIGPAGIPLSATEVVLDVDDYTPGLAEERIELTGGRTYDVLIRISNRGPDGPDNGGQGPGGWGYVGLMPALWPCTADAAGAFSIGSPWFTPTVPIPITVTGVATVRLTGTITDGGRRWSIAAAVNDGPDPTIVVPTAIGGTTPLTPVPLQPGATTVLRTFLDPAAVPPGVVPWRLETRSTSPPPP